MKKHLFVALFYLFVTAVSLAQTTPATLQWERSQNGSASLQHYLVKSIPDGAGNIYALANANEDIVVVKFNSAGGVAQTYIYNNSSNSNDYAKDFTIDASGNIYIVGYSWDLVNWGPVALAVKFNAAGTLAWDYKYRSPNWTYGYDQTINALALDASNNIYFTGSYADSLMVGKFNSSGAVQYISYLTIAFNHKGTGDDIVVDGTGNAYVSGRSRAVLNNSDAIAFKVNSTGVLQWSKTIAGAAGVDDNSLNVAIDNSSNVYVLSNIADTSSTNYTPYLNKYNASGAQQFQKKLHVTSQYTSNPIELIADNLGNTYCGIHVRTTSSFGYTRVIKHNSLGTQSYDITIDVAGADNDGITDLFLDVNNNVFATGNSNGPLYGDSYYAKINSSGSLLFANQLTGTSIVGGSPSIVADASGFMNIIGTNNKLYDARLSNTGVFQFEGNFAGQLNTVDKAVKVIAQGNNSIYALGYVANETSGADAVITKYDTYGNIQWQNMIDNNNEWDEAYDMGKDSIYNIYVLKARQVGSEIIKFDSIGSPLWTANSSVTYRKALVNSDGKAFLAASAEVSNSSFKIFHAALLDETGNFVFESTLTSEPDYKLTLGSIGVDANNNLIIAGDRKYLENDALNRKLAIVVDKYSSTGTLVWHKEIPMLDSTTQQAVSGSYVSKVLVNANNDIYVFGTNDTIFPGLTKTFITKINAAGTILWTQYLNGSGQGHEYSADARFLSNGQIILLSGSPSNFKIRKINPNTGAIIWETLYANGVTHEGVTLRVDAADDIYFVGQSSPGYYSRDLILGKINSSGVLKWATAKSGALFGNDFAAHMDVTNAGRIYIGASMVNNSGSGTDFSLLKFCDIPQPSLVIGGPTENLCAGSTVTLSAVNSYSYLWSDNVTTNDTLIVGVTGDYYCTNLKSDGCSKNTDTVHVQMKLPPTVPQICLVTVDSLSTHNIIVWDKSAVVGASAFNIFREDVTNVYSYIATVAYDSLSEYHDFGANPNVTTKRYKMSAIDSCGQESLKGNYHNTLYIVSNGAGQFSWNPLYTIENTANPVNNYVLMRDDNSTGNWVQIASTAGTQNTIVDPAYASFPNASYRVETLWNITCTPTRGAINTTRSNIKSPTSIGVDELSNINSFSVNPNPANESIVVSLSSREENAKVEIYNALGQKVKSQEIEGIETKIIVQELQAGTYFVKLISKQNQATKKLIKY